MSVIDEIIVIDEANRQLQIDRVNDEILDEIIINDNSYHFAKQKDLEGTTEIYVDNAVKEPLRGLEVQGNTIQDGTAKPEQPIPIQNASNTSATLSGANLYDISKVTGANRWNASTNPQVAGGTQYGTITDGVLHLKYGVYADNIFWTGAKIPIKQSGDYYVSCSVKIDSSVPTSGTTFRLLNKSKNNARTTLVYLPNAPIRGEWVRLAPKKVTVPDDWVGDDVYLILQSVGNASQYTNLKQYATNIMITYGEHTKYEPYVEPKTISIPSEVTLPSGEVVPLHFAKYGNTRDTLIVDNINNKVTYKQMIVRHTLTGNEPVNTYSYANAKGVQVTDVMKENGNRQKGYCSHWRKDRVGSQSGQAGEVWYGIGNKTIYWTGILDYLGFTTIAEFKGWVKEQATNGTPVVMQYNILSSFLPNYEFDITNTELGQELLTLSTNYGTNILTITSDLPVSQTDLSYWRQVIPNEPLESEI